MEKAQVGGKEKKFLKLFLENPKEDNGKKGAHIELFELGNFFCPVRAYFKWKQISKLDHNKEMPVFRHEDGSGLTSKEFNVELKLLMENVIDYSNSRISSHCFRAGITTTMARLGYSKEMISLQGRWSSDSFLRYCKQGRHNKLGDQLGLMEKMVEVANTWVSGGVLVH